MRMKIAFITHHFPPHFIAGAEQYAYRVVRELQRQGHSIQVICIESIEGVNSKIECRTEEFDTITVHRLHLNVRNAANPFRWSFRNPQLGIWIKRFLHRYRPDLVHYNSGYLLGGPVFEAAFDLNLPTVLSLHDFWFICPLITLYRTDGIVCAEPVPPVRCVWCMFSTKRRVRILGQRLSAQLGEAFVNFENFRFVTSIGQEEYSIQLIEERRAYLKSILERINLVIAPSHFLMDKVKEYGLAFRQFVYLPFGLDLEQIQSSFSPAPSSRLRIGYLGQFVPHKGLRVLLFAFRELIKRGYPAELSLYGDITGKTDYERKVLRIARRITGVKFMGRYDNRQVGEILKGLDVIVVPSRWYENRPTVILEAFASQIPVVAARIGGIPELVDHDQNGLLFEPHAVNSLTAQLQRLFDEPGLLSRLKQGIMPVMSVEEEVTQLVSLYQTLLPEK